MIGRKVGPYEVVRELGRGGMGVVYEVRHPGVPRPLALKLMLAGGASREALARFEREARLLARVRHRHVLQVHALDTCAEGPYLVTDFVEGTPLDRLTGARRGGRPLEPLRAAALLRDLADGLAAVHAQGILHRDLKPANVMVRPDGAPVLLDFGLARDVEAERLTQTGATLGTPAFMSPEQADGTSPTELDARVDVYGLGAVLFACLAGRPPFEGETAIAMIYKVLRVEPEWPAAPDRASGWLVDVGRRAMAKSPEARYASALELREDLDRLLAGHEPLAARAAAERAAAHDEEQARRRGRARMVAGAALAALVITAALAGGAALGRRERARDALRAAEAFEAETLSEWALGLGEGAPPGSDALASIDRHLAALGPATSALTSAEADRGAAQLDRLRAARHALAGTTPDAATELGAHEWVVVGLRALDAGQSAALALTRATRRDPGAEWVRWFELEVEARRVPLDVLARVAATPPDDRRRAARGMLERALARGYVEALGRVEPDRVEAAVAAAQALGLDLAGLAAAKAAALDALPPLPASNDAALDVLGRWARLHAAAPPLPAGARLAAALRERLQRLAREALPVVSETSTRDERVLALDHVLRFEGLCAWPLRVDTRLDEVRQVLVKAHDLQVTLRPDHSARIRPAALRVGAPESITPEWSEAHTDRATLEAIRASGDPLGELLLRWRKTDDDAERQAQLEGVAELLLTLPGDAIHPVQHGLLVAFVVFGLSEASRPEHGAARVELTRALVQRADPLLRRARPKELGATYENLATVILKVQGRSSPEVLTALREGEEALRVGADAPEGARHAHAMSQIVLCRELVGLRRCAEAEQLARAALSGAPLPGAIRVLKLLLSRAVRLQGRAREALQVVQEVGADDRAAYSDVWIEEALVRAALGETPRALELLEQAERRFRDAETRDAIQRALRELVGAPR